MTTISQRNAGSVWDKRARYIEQSTPALQRYVAMGDIVARYTKMKEYTPQQAHEADISLYNRLSSDEQRTCPGKMPERSSSIAHTSETTGWGKKHLAVSGVSHQPYVQTGHHSGAISVGLPMDNSPLNSGDTPSLNYTSSRMSGYYPSSPLGSDESASKSFSTTLKIIKTGSATSSESDFSNRSGKIPIVDEYAPYSKILRKFHANDDSDDEPVARELFAPNVKYEETDPHFDLNRASTSESPRPPVKNGVTRR